MTRVEDLPRLSPHERLQLLRFVASFAWSDLAITAGERAYVHRLPAAIPREHRRLFLDAVRETVAADGDFSPEEKETLAVLDQLTR